MVDSIIFILEYSKISFIQFQNCASLNLVIIIIFVLEFAEKHCCYFLGVDLVLQIKIMKDRLEQSKQTFADFFPSAFSSYC